MAEAELLSFKGKKLNVKSSHITVSVVIITSSFVLRVRESYRINFVFPFLDVFLPFSHILNKVAWYIMLAQHSGS